MAGKVGFVSFLLEDRDLPITAVCVQSGAYLGFYELIYTIVHSWEWIGVAYGCGVAFPVVYAKPEASIFLRGEQYWRCPFSLSGFAYVCFQLFIDFCMYAFTRLWAGAVRCCLARPCTRGWVYAVLCDMYLSEMYVPDPLMFLEHGPFPQ